MVQLFIWDQYRYPGLMAPRQRKRKHWTNKILVGDQLRAPENFSVEFCWILLRQNFYEEISGQIFWWSEIQQNSMMKMFYRIESRCYRHIMGSNLHERWEACIELGTWKVEQHSFDGLWSFNLLKKHATGGDGYNSNDAFILSATPPGPQRTWLYRLIRVPGYISQWFVLTNKWPIRTMVKMQRTLQKLTFGTKLSNCSWP